MLINFAEHTLWEALSNREGLEMREELGCIKGRSSRNGLKSLVSSVKPRVSVVSRLPISLSVEEEVLALIVHCRMAVNVKKTISVLCEKAFLINTEVLR